MKRILVLGMAALALAAALTACGPFRGAAQSPAPSASQAQPDAGGETQVIRGTINRMDTYLVLLTDDGEYQVMDFGSGVTLDGFSEGDSVKVTYSGELGNEDAAPVITAIEKAE